MAIKKRKFSQFVKMLDTGEVVTRTPAECTSWDNEFRLRVVRDYKAPRTMMETRAIPKYPDKEYKIQGRQVRFRQIFKELDNFASRVVCVRTEIIDVKRKKGMVLTHDEPAMRMLMIYSFLTEKEYGGVAPFQTFDWI